MAGRLEDVSRDLDAPIQEGEFLDEVSPEAAEKLFKAIVLATIEDACLDLPEVPGETPPADWVPSKRSKAENRDEAWRLFVQNRKFRFQEARRKRDEARSMLLGRDSGFEIICQLAGWDAGYLRRKAKVMAATGWVNHSLQEAA